MQDMSEDSGLVRVIRISAVLLGVALVVLGVALFEGSLFETTLRSWGWLLRAAVGGGTMGAGAGLGIAGWTGDDRLLDRIRGAQDSRKPVLHKGGEDSLGKIAEGSDGGETSPGTWEDE